VRLPDRLSRALQDVAEIFRPRDARFADLLREEATCAARAGALLMEYLANPRADKAQMISILEQRSDDILAEIQGALREALVTPLSGSDINYLGNAIDDLVDQFEDMVTEDAALEAAGIGTGPYAEENYGVLLSCLSGAFDLLPVAVVKLFRDPRGAQEAIGEMRTCYQDGKRAYSLAYAALMQGGEQHPGFTRRDNRLRWLRLHLRRIEKLGNALAGILANR